jgi:hypothetical protein
MKRASPVTLAFLLALTLSPQAHAQAADGHTIVVEQPWARATPAGVKTGAAYMTLVNKGNGTDQLLGASTPVAQQVQFHKETEENGIARMREQPTVEIAPGATVAFKPEDMHMMLLRLNQPLKEGQSFPLTLNFEKAGKIDVTVTVAGVGARQP